MAHTGTTLSECGPKNRKKVKFCHFRISISRPNVGRMSHTKNQTIQGQEAYKVQ